MNIAMKDAIRRLRRERDVTQETLADALGVTFQSVSRWETGQAYPDIELIPRIAEYFGVSVDVLFGTDKGTAEARRHAYIDEIEKYDTTDVWYGATEEARRDGDKYIAANYAMMKEFPDDEFPIFNLIRFYTRVRKAEIPAHLEELRGYCRRMIETSTNEDYRAEALENLTILAEDDEAERIMEFITPMYNSREVILARRYDYHDDVDMYNRQTQKNFREWLRFMLYGCIGKRDRDRYRNAEASVAGDGCALKMIDALRDTSTDRDAWLPMRAFLSLRLAAAHFGAGETEAGYETLERAVDMLVMIGELPPETDLSYNCPLLDLLTVNKGRSIDEGAPGSYILHYAYIPLTSPSGWEWFNCVREDERYKQLVRRLEPYLPESDVVEL